MNLRSDAPILIVDDFSTMRRIVRNALKQLGFTNVDDAENGQEAWQMVRAGQYELIISDWNMPGVTGLQLLTAVRSDARLRSTPFLMVTAEAKRENIVEAMQAGVSDYIVKPFNQQTLQAKLSGIFAVSKAA